MTCCALAPKKPEAPVAGNSPDSDIVLGAQRAKVWGETDLVSPHTFNFGLDRG